MMRRGWVLAVLFCGLVGCSHTQTRAQSADDPDLMTDPDIKSVKTIADVGSFSRAEPIQVSGVGLVILPDETGGGNPAGQYKQMLEEQLLKQGVKDVKQLLASPKHVMVLVSARIPYGIRRGDPLDIEVTLPPTSKATSLRGGYLVECPLKNYENAQNLSSSATSATLIPGHQLAKAHGPLLVGFGEGNEELRLRRGRIWQGGQSLIDLPVFLYLNNDQQFATVANTVASRINAAFPDDTQKRAQVDRAKRLHVLDEVDRKINEKFSMGGINKDQMAHAVNKDVIQIKVPYEYRLDPDRYLHVLCKIPLSMTPEQGGKYRNRLHQLVLDPKETVAASLRLEALGTESIPALKKGLTHDSTLVRFASATALAYLGSTSGIEELARLAERYDSLRGQCLTALAGFDEAMSATRLSEMMASPKPQLRYGAFRALLALNEANPDLRGEFLNDAYWLHHVAADAPSMVHISTSRRAEIVLFGQPAALIAPFRIKAGEFTVTAADGDSRCIVSRFQVEAGHMDQKQCSMKLEDVLKTMANLGSQYPDAVEFLRQVERNKCLTCAVQVDALPPATDLAALAAAGGDVSQFKNATDASIEDIVAIQQDLAIEPTPAVQRTAQNSRGK
jgi:hypothetical protein